MVIHEHVKGTIVIPIYDDSGEFADRTADINFTEDDIIKDSCTITARACDDNTFSLGGVRSAELSIKLRLDGEGVNAYFGLGVPWLLLGHVRVACQKRLYTACIGCFGVA